MRMTAADYIKTRQEDDSIGKSQYRRKTCPDEKQCSASARHAIFLRLMRST